MTARGQKILSPAFDTIQWQQDFMNSLVSFFISNHQYVSLTISIAGSYPGWHLSPQWAPNNNSCLQCERLILSPYALILHPYTIFPFYIWRASIFLLLLCDFAQIQGWRVLRAWHFINVYRRKVSDFDGSNYIPSWFLGQYGSIYISLSIYMLDEELESW